MAIRPETRGNQMKINPYIEQQSDELIRLRRHFHQYPELSMQEYKTARKIEEELQAAGIPTQRIGETGVLGTIRGGSQYGPKIVLRADTDALGIQDAKTVPYASLVSGVMHACGHDAHTAALIGAAKALAARKSSLPGEVALVFQPGEEYGQGADAFLQAGVMKGAARTFAIHMDSSFPAGQIALSPEVTNASVDHFIITIHGKSAHVSVPEQGTDALYIASQTVIALQAIVSRLTNPRDPVVVGIGVLHAGDAYNIVAGTATIEGTIRCLSPETRTFVKQKLREIAEKTSKIYGGTAEVTLEDFASPVVNNQEVYQEIRGIAAGIVGPENLRFKAPSMGGDNFSEFLKKTPGLYAYIGSSNPEKPSTTLPHHTNLFDIDEQAILIAASLYTEAALL